jgi:hypothetical protein
LAAPSQPFLLRSATIERALLGAGFLVLFFFLPHELFADDLVRYGDLQVFLHHGTTATDPYSLAGPLVSAPLVALGNWTGSPVWWASRFNVVVVALGALAAARLLRGRVDPSLLRRTLLLLLFVSLLTDRLRDYNAEVLTGTLFALGLICIATGRHVVLGWAGMVLGAVNTPAALVPLALVAVVEALRTRRLRWLLPIAASAVLIMAEDWIRRGGPLATGYLQTRGVHTNLPYSGRPGFSYPFVLGLVSILFSAGRGLLFFTPGLTLWLSSATRRLAGEARRLIWLMVIVVIGLVLIYAKWWAWYAGLAWGPRFFTFAALPSSLLIAVRLRAARRSARADALTLLVLAVSAWVAFAGVIANPHALAVCGRVSRCWYIPEFSSLWYPLRVVPPISTPTAIAAAYVAIVFAYLAEPLVSSIAAGGARAWRSAQLGAGWKL